MSAPPSRPVKPPRCARLIVEASPLLKWQEKAVWLKLDALNVHGRGAIAGAEALAELLGLGARNVERLRLNLTASGLLTSEALPGRRGANWYATLPEVAIAAECRALKGTARCRGHSPAERRALVEALDGWIRIYRQDGGYAESRTELQGETTPIRVPDYADSRTDHYADSRNIGNNSREPNSKQLVPSPLDHPNNGPTADWRAMLREGTSLRSGTATAVGDVLASIPRTA